MLEARLPTKLKKATFVLLSLLVSTSLGSYGDSDDMGDGSKQISDLNVLLPSNGCQGCRKAVYNLTAENGCYSW
jgi:hypothetical protein